MPGLTSRDHAAIKRETMDRRNAFQRAIRAEPPRIIRVRDGDRQLLIAVSRSTPLVGYLLRVGDDGRLTCSCPGFAFRGTCAHVQAAASLTAPAPAAWSAAPAPVRPAAGSSGPAAGPGHPPTDADLPTCTPDNMQATPSGRQEADGLASTGPRTPGGTAYGAAGAIRGGTRGREPRTDGTCTDRQCASGRAAGSSPARPADSKAGGAVSAYDEVRREDEDEPARG